jgi:hypothetical protein
MRVVVGREERERIDAALQRDVRHVVGRLRVQLGERIDRIAPGLRRQLERLVRHRVGHGRGRGVHAARRVGEDGVPVGRGRHLRCGIAAAVAAGPRDGGGVLRRLHGRGRGQQRGEIVDRRRGRGERGELEGMPVGTQAGVQVKVRAPRRRPAKVPVRAAPVAASATVGCASPMGSAPSPNRSENTSEPPAAGSRSPIGVRLHRRRRGVRGRLRMQCSRRWWWRRRKRRGWRRWWRRRQAAARPAPEAPPRAARSQPPAHSCRWPRGRHRQRAIPAHAASVCPLTLIGSTALMLRSTATPSSSKRTVACRREIWRCSSGSTRWLSGLRPIVPPGAASSADGPRRHRRCRHVRSLSNAWHLRVHVELRPPTAMVNASVAWRPRRRGPTPDACARQRSGRSSGMHRGPCGIACGIRRSGWPRSS